MYMERLTLECFTAGATKVETLKGALAQAKKEAEVSKVATDKADKELEVEQTTHQRHEAQVGEVE